MKAIKKILLNDYENSTENGIIEQLNTLEGIENINVNELVKEWFSIGIKEFLRRSTSDLGLIESQVYISLLIYNYTINKDTINEELENLSLYINSEWLDFGFNRLGFKTEDNIQLIAAVIYQYYDLGYEDEIEKIYIDRMVINLE